MTTKHFKRFAQEIKQEQDRTKLEYTATRLRTVWAIRPKGALGTCGWINGIPWNVIYLKHKPANIIEE